MSLFNSFDKNKLNIALIGASGGIGGAMKDLILSDTKCGNLYCFSRSGQDHHIDVSDETSIKAAADSIEDTLDIVLIPLGILHDGDNLQPEKSIRDIGGVSFARIIAVNTIGPALIGKYFLPKLPREGKSVFAALSARVGSISDNRIGGWYAYRASKAALNMVLKNFAIEMARKYKETVILGLHPGTVNTSLSKPFQGQVKEGKLFTPAFSAQKLLHVINARGAEDSGKVFDWDNQEVPA